MNLSVSTYAWQSFMLEIFLWQPASIRCVLLVARGPIDSFALVSDQDSCQPRGFGFIEMSNADAACARH